MMYTKIKISRESAYTTIKNTLETRQWLVEKFGGVVPNWAFEKLLSQHPGGLWCVAERCPVAGDDCTFGKSEEILCPDCLGHASILKFGDDGGPCDTCRNERTVFVARAS